jgi:hypothetical protein
MDRLGRTARAFRSARMAASSYSGSQTKRLLNASTSAKPAGNDRLTVTQTIGVFAFFGVMDVLD